MKDSFIQEDTDVLVIGGGLAGLWAAIKAKERAKKVIVADKGKIGRSGVSIFCHHMIAPVPDAQSDAWLEEYVERSGYLANQALLKIGIEDSRGRFQEMIDWGVEFEKDKEGKLRTEAVRGQKITRGVLYNGNQMMMKMREEALRRGVEFRERVMVMELLTSDGNYPTQGHVVGAVGLNTRTSEFLVFRAKAIIIASGAMATKMHVLYADGLSGDGLAMAFRAGAELIGMEFAPHHAFGIWNRKFSTGGQQQFLMNDARIVNSAGERIMEKYMAQARVANPEFDGQVEFGDICRAIAIENLEGRGPCYFDLRGWSDNNVDKMRKVLPKTMLAFDDFGIDVRKQLIESTPMTVTYHTSNQCGIRINESGESTVAGLYGAGSTVFIGAGLTPQGFCGIIGSRAGEAAAQRARETNFNKVPEEQRDRLRMETLVALNRKQGKNPDELFLLLNKTIIPYEVSFFKNEERIKNLLGDLEHLTREELPLAKAENSHDLVKVNEFRHILLILKLINLAALERKESRFAFFREEYPYQDNQNWLKWIVQKNNIKGDVETRIEPIPFDQYPVKPPVPSKIPVYTSYTLSKKKGSISKS